MQEQQRHCENGTGFEVCSEADSIQTVSCALAGTSLPECPKVYGNWVTVGPCVTLGLETDCGPGVQVQQRTCKDGTGSQICRKEDELDNKIMKKIRRCA